MRKFSIANLARGFISSILLLFSLPVAPCQATEQGAAVDYLTRAAIAPAEYVLAKFEDHRIVIVGENHWLKHDADLILELIPRLKTRGVTAIGVEMFRVSDQETIDRLTISDRWDGNAAMRVMRTSEWPYREYFEMIHAVWKVNQGVSAQGERLRLIALGPQADWRTQLLPLGQNYDTFMSKTVADYLKQPSQRMLIYCGVHHAFTRYYQPELPRDRRVEQFMDRMGNILWRGFGEEVFTITLHRPWQCRVGPSWGRCLPLDGAIDCAAQKVGHPSGFDVAHSPFAEMKVGSEFYYAQGYFSLRLGDMTDGYIWTMPLENYKAVELIPLSEFAPDSSSLEYVSQHNPFSAKKGLSRSEIERLAAEEATRLRNFIKSSGWETLTGWREQCRK